MKYRSYDKYTYSAIMWINLVPKHWGIQKLKFITSCNDDVLGEDVDPDLSIRYVDIGSVSEGKILVAEDMSFSNAPSRARRLVRHGDIIISTVRTYLRAIAEINNPPKNMVVSTGFAVIRPREIDRKYLAYALKSHSFVEWIVAESKGISYPAINASELMRLSVALPSREEQTAVATFLDHQTSQIDQLINKKARFIELLKEKRAALITEAVTGKFDVRPPGKGEVPESAGSGFGVRTGKPYPEYKDSGVEWLGEVPTHWNVIEIKRLAHSFKTGPFGSLLHQSDYIEGGVPIVNPIHMEQGKIIPAETSTVDRKTADKLSEYRLEEGDIVFARRGELGRCALVAKEQAGWLLGTGSIRLRTAYNMVDIGFLMDVLISDWVKDYLSLMSVGSTMENLNTSILSRIPVPYPSSEEQKIISKYIEINVTNINQLIKKTQQSIDLLKEKRAALITAGVTGKIDVRDWN